MLEGEDGGWWRDGDCCANDGPQRTQCYDLTGEESKGPGSKGNDKQAGQRSAA